MPSHSGYAEIAQLVEHDLAKVGVASSSLVFRSKISPAVLLDFFSRKLFPPVASRHPPRGNNRNLLRRTRVAPWLVSSGHTAHSATALMRLTSDPEAATPLPRPNAPGISAPQYGCGAAWFILPPQTRRGKPFSGDSMKKCAGGSFRGRMARRAQSRRSVGGMLRRRQEAAESAVKYERPEELPPAFYTSARMRLHLQVCGYLKSIGARTSRSARQVGQLWPACAFS